MAELAIKPMTLDEFLRWDDGTETHYELIAGFPAVIARSIEAQRVIAVRLATRIDAGLSGRRPCRALIQAGVIAPERADTYFVADIAATCAPVEPRRQVTKDPFLIVEILSPSTERHDRRLKLPDYRQISTVREIVLIASDGLYAELHRRSGTQWITETLCDGEARLSLTSVGVEIAIADLYEGIALEDTVN
jgi:Uma2 family endonuclease